MKYRYLLPMLAMTSCSTLKSPEEDYITTIQLAAVTIDGATAYAQDCARKPKGHACEAVVLKLEQPVRLLEGAKARATQVIVTKDSPYYDASEDALQNAINDVRKILIGGGNV